MGQLIHGIGKLTPTKIAVLLFRINLLPACIAPLGMFMLGGFQLTIKALGATVVTVLMEILLLLGIACEFVYFYQKKYLRWADSKIAWLYSIVLNAVFVIHNAMSFFSQEPPQSNDAQKVFTVLLLLYPSVFFILSSVALYKIYTYNAVTNTEAELN